jgi:hypothetical protein
MKIPFIRPNIPGFAVETSFELKLMVTVPPENPSPYTPTGVPAGPEAGFS